jgi:hypothetical protein
MMGFTFGKEITLERGIVGPAGLRAVNQQGTALDPGEVLFHYERHGGGDRAVEAVGVFAMIGVSVVRQDLDAGPRSVGVSELRRYSAGDNQTRAGAECD